MAKKLRDWPKLETDDDVDAFVQDADLSQYDFGAGAMKMGEWLARFEANHKDSRVNLRLPAELVDAYKARAREENIPYQRLMRLELQKALIASGVLGPSALGPGVGKAKAKGSKPRKPSAA